MSADTMRREFEAWYSDAEPNAKSIELEANGCYKYIGAQNCWIAWQAARRQDSELTALRVRVEAAEKLVERLKQEAKIHAQEARTQRATVHEIYQVVSGSTGERGDWNGAEPVRKKLAAMLKEEPKP